MGRGCLRRLRTKLFSIPLVLSEEFGKNTGLAPFVVVSVCYRNAAT